jgi:hypothetical protein
MRPGDVLDDRFEVIGFHRAGGMGEVHRGRDRTNGREVAIKLVKRIEGTAEQRFDREVAIMSEMHDPGIVEYVGHGVASDGRRYLVMEWLEGEDLHDRLVRAPLGAIEAVSMGLAVARALAAAHARGVVHRDLKPQNVFLMGGAPSRAKLLDFGLARAPSAVPDITRTGITVGTRGYMAPEQALGEKNVGPKVDLFSLGCVLYEAIVGRAPFYARDPDEVLRKVVFDDVAPIVEELPDVPKKLSALVDAMLSKEAGDRPRDAAAVAASLEVIERESLIPGVVLSVIEGPDATKRIVTAEKWIDIGKHPRATFALSDRAASRFHCEVRIDGARVTVRDLGSTNGLTVDEARVNEAPLADGSILGVGRTKILLKTSRVTPPMPPMQRAWMEDAHVIAQADANAVGLARSIHDASARRRGPFLIVPGNAYEESDIVAANGGTALVRDVERLPVEQQEALATLLETRTAKMRGAAASRLVDTRVIATSAADLRIAVNDGKLRPALYACLGAVRLMGGDVV